METNKEKTYTEKAMDDMIKAFHNQPYQIVESHSNKLSDLSLSDLISLHGWIDSEADLIEALGGDNTSRLEEAREQMTTIHKEIERRRNNLFSAE